MFVDHEIRESKAKRFESDDPDDRIPPGSLARDEALALVAWYPDAMNSVRAARLVGCEHVVMSADMLESGSIDYSYVANHGRTVTDEYENV